MTHGFDIDSPFHPNYLLAKAVLDAFPMGHEIVLRPEIVDGLTEPFTVIHVGEIVDSVHYFAGLFGEHNLEDMPVNPMNMEALVIGVQLVDGRLTIADALSVEAGTVTIAVANMLMVVQYGGTLTTSQQPDDMEGGDWTLLLEEFPERVTCARVATIEYDDNRYFVYVGDGVNDGTTEYFLLIVQVIKGECFSVDTVDDDLWNALLGVFLDHFGLGFDDGGDDDEEGGEEEDPDEEAEEEDQEEGSEIDTSIC